MTVNLRTAGLALGPLLAVALWLAGPPAGFSQSGWLTASVTVLMAVWWITEALPLPVTALVPLPLLPALDVVAIDEAAAPYASPVVFLFLGGFVIAAAVQRWGLHRRIALAIMALAGARPDRLVGGVMAASAVLSMWISNTATAAMMLPIALSVLAIAEGGSPAGGARSLAVALLLGIAYGANVGGMGTLIGTPPNAVFAGYLAENRGIEIGFVEWMAVGVPAAGVLLAGAWWLLARGVFRLARDPLPGVDEHVRSERQAIGPLSSPERRMIVVAALTILAWLTRPLLEKAIPGLTLTDPGIAITAAIALFIVPAGERSGTALLTWADTREIAWGVLILVGGGLSLGSAIDTSGLAGEIAAVLRGAGGLPLWGLMLIITALTMGLSHVTSNTGTTATLMPVVVGLAQALGESGVMFGALVALAASCAFMLPVATPPNAIVFASERLRVLDMVRAGAPIAVFAAAVVMAIAMLWVPEALG